VIRVSFDLRLWICVTPVLRIQNRNVLKIWGAVLRIRALLGAVGNHFIYQGFYRPEEAAKFLQEIGT
jgi:hypothetical protein